MLGDERLHDNEYAQERADDDFCPPSGESALEIDEGQNHALNEHAEKRSRHEPHAAGEKRAADNR